MQTRSSVAAKAAPADKAASKKRCLSFERGGFADARPNSQEDALALYAKYLAWREADGSAAALAEAAAPLGGTISQGFASLGPKTAGDRVLLVEGARYDSAFDHAASCDLGGTSMPTFGAFFGRGSSDAGARSGTAAKASRP